MSFSLHDAFQLAESAHAGQVDKLGVPYIEHVVAVADGLADFDITVQIAGMLHDAVEDTGYDISALRNRGVPERSLTAIALVSRNLHPELTYLDGIRRIALNADATLVKLSDNAHNSRPDRVAALTELNGGTSNPRYQRAREILLRSAGRDDAEKILARVAPALLAELA